MQLGTIILVCWVVVFNKGERVGDIPTRVNGLAEDDPSKDAGECLSLVDWRHWMAAIRSESRLVVSC